MSLHLLLTDLAAYSAQIALVVTIGSLAPMLLRFRRPDAILIYRHVLLAACLLLPCLQSWRRPALESSVDVSVSSTALSQSGDAARRGSLAPEKIAALLLCAGILWRLGWLGAGLLRLRRYRRRAQLIEPLPPVVHALQSRLGVWPSICLSEDVSGPVTFGILEPAVLLTPGFLAMPPGAQEAIACHELTHIKRRDWAVTIIEELVRAVFWFHPAIWWLLAQIQLAREQTVDAQVLRITASRDQYIDALLVIAAGRLQPDLVPAPSFLQKTQLARRIALIMKENSMSRKRLLSSLAAICGALVITARFATLYFPISAPAQEISRGEAGLLHRAPIEYPADAMEKGIQGTVVVSAVLNEHGVVTDARVISGPDPLRKAALKSVLDWHYADQTPSPVEVAVDFKLPIKTAPTPGKVLSGTLTQIQFPGVSASVREAVLSKLPVHEGDSIETDMGSRSELVLRLRRAVQEVDEHLGLNLHSKPNGDRSEFGLSIFYKTPMTLASDKPMPVLDAHGRLQRIRVGGNIQAANQIYAPRPAYPQAAKLERIQGLVKLNVVIGKDGTVQDLKVASGDPTLAEAALEAVRQWTYKPTLLNGQPVEIVTVVDVNFTLSR